MSPTEAGARGSADPSRAICRRLFTIEAIRSVVNPDNSAGWNIASEYGDKADPHWTDDGQRVVYIRCKDAVSRCCE